MWYGVWTMIMRRRTGIGIGISVGKASFILHDMREGKTGILNGGNEYLGLLQYLYTYLSILIHTPLLLIDPFFGKLMTRLD